MRERAQAAGALTVLSGAEVLDISTDGERVTGVVTSKGEIATENVVICCGVWSPKVAALAGARLALTPTVHQMISVGPIGLFAGTTGEISYPIVRDVDEGMYERQHGGDMEVGSYMHRPIIVRAGVHPVQRGGGALADRDAVHRRRLRPAARRRPLS